MPSALVGRTVRSMLDHEQASVFGVPNDIVTHWGIHRKDRDKWIRLSHGDAAGVARKVWPLEELAVEEVKRRWGAGEYRTYWEAHDPTNERPEARRIAQGNGQTFLIEDVPEPVAPSAPQVIQPPPGDNSIAQSLGFAMQLIQMTDQRSAAQLQALAQMAGMQQHGPSAPAGVSSELAEMKATLAAMQAQMLADAKQREIEDRHRAELAERDREIERLRREQETQGGGLEFEPGTPFLEQIGYAILNAATKKPEMLAALVNVAAPLLTGGAKPATIPPPPPPMPTPVAARPVPPVVRPIQPVTRAVRPEVVIADAADVSAPTKGEAWSPIGGTVPEQAAATS